MIVNIETIQLLERVTSAFKNFCNCKSCLNHKFDPMDIRDAIKHAAHNLGQFIQSYKDIQFEYEHPDTSHPDTSYINEHYDQGYLDGCKDTKKQSTSKIYSSGKNEGHNVGYVNGWRNGYKRGKEENA